MRLHKIKVAGFKSFVDPTTIPLPSNLIGIVGPNGCGKSNIIDAVRWVMGESSAKHLRGDSMADVVFNGSSSRKPVGQATVELVFDNSDGSLVGQYANYNEISIKRSVSRDGQSVYFLNGARCRRRDITDIFLGTGLGPRSYAIIEQGTISRIVEAKPEELRVFLEEAAGISKYKERRRETENRIRHTRENLDRLDDLREEVEKHIAHLQRQARTAERYKVLKEEERLAQAQLLGLRWQSINEQAAGTEKAIAEQQTALEAARAAQRGIEAEIEQQREFHVEATDAFNEVQSRFYGVGADIARLEQSIQHARERRQQQQQDLAQISGDRGEVQSHLDADRRKNDELHAALAELEPQLAERQSAQQATGAALAEAEQAMQDWQALWDDFNTRAGAPAQRAEVERTRIEQLEKHLLQLQERETRHREELSANAPDALRAEVATLESRYAESERATQSAQAGLAENQQEIQSLRNAIATSITSIDSAREHVQKLHGERARLEALQQVALGKQEGAVSDWLRGQQLDEAPRLAEELDVEHGWERALECVLGFNLEAVCVPGLEPLGDALGALREGSVTLFDTSAAPHAADTAGGTPLLDKVRAPWRLDALLAGVYAVEGLSEALTMRGRLGAGESVVTRDGLWLGNGWLRVVRDADAKAGVLEREQELKGLIAALDDETGRLEQMQQRLEQDRERRRELEAQREQNQAELNRSTRMHADLQSELSARRVRLEQVQASQGRLETELREIGAQVERDTHEIADARTRLETAVEQISGFEQQRQSLEEQRASLRSALDEARAAAQADREAAQQLQLRAGSLRTESGALVQSMQRLETQLAQLVARHEELEAAIAGAEAPLSQMGAELETQLALRKSVEAELAGARRKLETIDHAMRELEERRGSAEQAVQEARELLEQTRIASQEFKVRRQTLVESVAQSGFELETLLREMPEEASEQTWQEKVEGLERRIQRLGPINLAAIDEFEQESERKKYLDAQNEDLTQALETLEGAIRKIDRETRTRFKETYDKVNSGLQGYFPRLFGGGHAYLEMTSDDLLETGVTVMARPPGKRNSTIHLLSGGEKALTAVALVYAIFQLNPAPFCLLDEVDAPLDDANVSRYCELLKAMSDRTQFIFITHNKLTMEIAHQLTGVTMNEPGVSHLVAVDVDEAVELAAV